MLTSQNNKSEQYMRRCIELARMGLGDTAPNPMVGSVIVHQGKIIGEGYHKRCGQPHAEVNAIESVKDKRLLKESTLYVNLEPCSHFGRTPPCSDFIIKHEIPEVIIGMVDINPEVSGRGIRKMEDAGCKVKVGVLEGECIALNKRFITFYEKKRPYIIIKWAQSQDGYVDIKRDHNTPQGPVWISDPRDLLLVHKWRAEEQAIMVGTNTVLNDNPRLTTRLWSGDNPLRVFVDRSLKIPGDYNIFDDSSPTLVITEKDMNDKPGVHYEQIDFSKNIIPRILDVLYEHSIQSVMIEGGSFLHNSFIKEGIWDEARIFAGRKAFKDGLVAPELEGELISVDEMSAGDLYVFENPSEKIVVPYEMEK